MADQWYKFGHGFLLVYSITDRPTFDAIYGFHQDVLRVKDRQYVPCVVASNKVCPFMNDEIELMTVRFGKIETGGTIRRSGYGKVVIGTIHRMFSK